jgi:hypothetical protein
MIPWTVRDKEKLALLAHSGVVCTPRAARAIDMVLARDRKGLLQNLKEYAEANGRSVVEENDVEDLTGSRLPPDDENDMMGRIVVWEQVCPKCGTHHI